MALADQPVHAPHNRLLAALPPETLAALWPQLEPVELALRQVLHEPGKPIATIYFPETGWISMVAYLEDGDAAEVGLVGREGFVGLPVLLGGDCDDLEAMVQCQGTALRMDARAFREALERIPAFRTLLLRYALAHHGQVARTAACNGRHQIDQRLARWLMMAHDRVEGDEYPMTHEFLSLMLGVRRAGITVAAGQLAKAGFIHYEKGHIQVTDRLGLESVSCECYGVARRASDVLLGQAEGSGLGGEYRCSEPPTPKSRHHHTRRGVAAGLEALGHGPGCGLPSPSAKASAVSGSPSSAASISRSGRRGLSRW